MNLPGTPASGGSGPFLAPLAFQTAGSPDLREGGCQGSEGAAVFKVSDSLVCESAPRGGPLAFPETTGPPGRHRPARKEVGVT